MSASSSPTFEFFVIAMAVHAVSMTVTMSALFFPIRRKLKASAPWAGGLVSCPHCFAHWTAFAAVWSSGFRSFRSGHMILDYLITSFAVIGLASFLNYALMKISGTHPD